MRTEAFTPTGYEGALTLKVLTFDEKTDFQEEIFKARAECDGDDTLAGFKMMRAGKKKLFADLIQGVELKHEKTGREIKSKEDFEYEADAIKETVMVVLLGASGEKEKLAEGNDEAK